MHAYLLVGDLWQEELTSLSKKLNAVVMEFPIAKIDDVRSLNALLRLQIQEPTIIVSPNIDDATEEALNAFLKNLEEPQENIYFVLTANSSRKVLPTIVSRCQVIRVKKGEEEEKDEISDFLDKSVGEKLKYVENIKVRDDARAFLENVIENLHGSLHKEEVDPLKIAKNLETTAAALKAIRKNGNIVLTLTNFVINLN